MNLFFCSVLCRAMRLPTFILLLFPVLFKAQYEATAKNSFLNEHIQQTFEYWNITSPGFKFHAAFRPYLSSTYLSATDTALPFRAYPFKNFFLSNTFNERPEARNWFNLQLHPLLQNETGHDFLTSSLRQSNYGGIHLKLNVNDDFTFAGTVLAGFTQLPFFADTFLSSKAILPEFGQATRRANGSLHYADWQGYFSYSPNNNKVFNFQLGRGKHFIGNGHRSVLLSDLAPAYPFFRINTNIWHLQYNVWYTWMYDVENSGGLKNHFKNKFGTFHYLSWNATPELNIGLFENIIWRGTDTNQVRTFDVNYLNPLIFYRPAEYSVGSPDNSFLGLNISWTLAKTLRLYGQLGLDEFFLREIRARRGWWANKQAWQLGMRYVNAFSIKGLSALFEYNQARPYTYTHGLVEQNYGHYGFPLAHPLGANFKEFIADLRFRSNSSEWQLFAMAAFSGSDTLYPPSNVGSNIFLSYTTRHSEYGHHTGQGIPTTQLHLQLRYTWFILPSMNLRLEAGLLQRFHTIQDRYILQNPYLFLSLKSGFWNNYRDF